MPSDGPITFTIAAATSFAWAHNFFGRCCRCPRMGPWHSQQQLPIDLLGPIISLAAVVDALRWAHNIYNSSCHFICLGPYFLRQVLSMPSDRHMAFAVAAAD